MPWAAQDLLAQICIKEGATSVAYRRLLADAGSDWGRRLMAGGEGADGSGDYLNACGPGEESLWPVSLQHDTHVGTQPQPAWMHVTSRQTCYSFRPYHWYLPCLILL